MADRLAAALKGEAGIVLAPRLGSLAETVCGESWAAMATDAGRIVPAAKRLAALFKSDSLLLGDDPAMLSLDGAPANGRLDAALDAAARLADDAGALPCVVILPGPMAAARRTGWAEGEFPEAIKESLTAAAEGFCQARPPLILFDESEIDAADLGTMTARKIYNTLRNVAGYFDVAVGVVARGVADGEVATRLKVDALLLACPGGDALPDAALLTGLAEECRLVGFAVPAADPTRAAELHTLAAQTLPDRPVLFTTLAGNGGETIETMHQLMGALRGAA